MIVRKFFLWSLVLSGAIAIAALIIDSWNPFISIGVIAGSFFSFLQVCAFRGSFVFMVNQNQGKRSRARVIFQYILAFVVLFALMAVAAMFNVRLFFGIAIGLTSFPMVIVFAGLLGRFRNT